MIDCKHLMRIALVFHIIAVMIFSPAWGDENLLFKRKVGFSPRRISWAHLPNLYSQPHSESWIDLDGDKDVDLLVFLPEQQTDRVKAFFGDGSFAWEFKVGREYQPKRELGAFALAAFDVDSDGVKEIICGTNDLRLYALDAYSGALKKEIQLKDGCYVYSMTVGDVNGDGIGELLVACAGNAEWGRRHVRILPKSRGYIYALDKELNTIWHTPVGNIGVLFGHFVFAGDLDGDEKEEVIIPDLSGNFYLLDDDGNILWTKNVKEIDPKRRPSHVDYALIADVDEYPKNGNELVIAAQESGGCLYNRDGQLLWRATEDISHGQYCAVADVRYDKKGKEVLFFDKTGEKILLFTSYGEKLWQRGIGYMAVTGGFINWSGDGTKAIIAAAGRYVLIFNEYGQFIDRLSHPSLLSHQGMIANVAGDFREEYIAIMEDEFFVFSTLLKQNYPNPIDLETWIPYQLPQNTDVVIRIYNIKGQLIRTITLGNKQAGIYVTKDKATYWDSRDSFGEKVASGVYFYTLQAGEFRETRQMVILK